MKEHIIYIRNIGLVAVTQILLSLRGIILLPILTKSLETSGYGIYSQIIVIVTLLLQFTSLGLGASLLRFLPSKNRKEIAQGFSTALFLVLISGLFFSLLLFFSSAFLADIFIKDLSAVPIVQITSILLILQTLEMMSFHSFRVFGQIKRYSIIFLSKSYFEICLIAYFVLSGYGTIGIIFALIISEFAFLLIILILTYSYAEFAFPDFSLIRPYLKFSLPLISLGIFEIIVSSSDRLVIGFYKEASSVGIYSAAYNLGFIAWMVGPFIIFMLSPTIANLFDKMKMDAVKSYLAYSLKYYLMFSIPSAFGLSILARPILSILTTQEFVLMGIYIVPVVASSMIFYGLYAVFSEVLKLYKRTSIIVLGMGVGAITNFGLNLIVIPHWGIFGAAVTTQIAYVLAAAIVFYKSRQYMKFDINLNFIIKSILSSGIITILIWIINPVNWWEVLFSVGVGVCVYFILLFILKGFGKQEIKTIIRAIGLGRLYEKFFQKID